MGTKATAPSPPPNVRPATAGKTHLENRGMSFTTEAQKCGSEAKANTVRKVLSVENSVRLLVVTTTRLVNTDGGNSAWTKNTSYGNTTTSHGQDTSNTTVTAVVWPDYGPTPDLSKRFWGRKERDSEKQD
ncbi:hypothetical protein Taro_016221 [Colocasia esculenta]|uniref:Uncharacterized protein n=1 Tax=Colocasia esculenta TaxID=4460 RepID=A0A843UPI2_COLES|nr:hypothetical protein [Colocasia esculenta]